MIERLRNIYGAIIGRKATCGGNCSCHSVGGELGNVESEGSAGVGDSINLKGVDPQVAEMLRGLASPDKQEELLAAMNVEEEPQVCVHLDNVPVCRCGENDSKPEWCSSSRCPVRVYQVVLEDLRKKAALIAYG